MYFWNFTKIVCNKFGKIVVCVFTSENLYFVESNLHYCVTLCIFCQFTIFNENETFLILINFKSMYGSFLTTLAVNFFFFELTLILVFSWISCEFFSRRKFEKNTNINANSEKHAGNRKTWILMLIRISCMKKLAGNLVKDEY